MTHRGVSRGLLTLAALWLSVPDASLAGDAYSRTRPRSHTSQTSIPRSQVLGPAVGYHSYSPPPPWQQNNPVSRPPLLAPHSHHHYPHGHRLHVHGPSCAPVMAPYVHVLAAPIWQVFVYPQSFDTGQAMLQIIVTAAEGDIYVDDLYLGSCASLQGHPMNVPVLPGSYVVYFVHRGNTHRYQVYVEADSTTVVQASLR